MRQRRSDPRAAPSSPARVRGDILAWLARRDHTEAELREKLGARDYSPDDIDAGLNTLVADGTVDDRRVARAHVETATRVKSRGRLRIARELAARGVPAATAADALQAMPAEEEAAALARWLSRQRLPEDLSRADRERLYRRLVRKGFDTDLISRALRTRHDD